MVVRSVMRCNLTGNGSGGSVRQMHRPLGDVLGQVAHAFQVGVDLQGRRDAAQVDGDRLVQGEHFQAFLLDMVLILVDLPVPVDDLLGQRGLPRLQAI